MNWNKQGALLKIIAGIAISTIATTQAKKCFENLFNIR